MTDESIKNYIEFLDQHISVGLEIGAPSNIKFAKAICEELLAARAHLADIKRIADFLYRTRDQVIVEDGNVRDLYLLITEKDPGAIERVMDRCLP